MQIPKDSDLVSTFNGCQVYGRDLKTLTGIKWLNDKVKTNIEGTN